MAQLILAGRGEDTESWTNILFIVVLAVFWVVGGIIKATRKKPEGNRMEQSSGKPLRHPVPTKVRQPLAGRPISAAGPGHPRADQQPVREATAKPRSRLEKLAAEFEKALGPYISEAPPEPKPRLHPVSLEPVDVPKDVLVERTDVRPAPPKETPETEHLPELVLDYTNPDELTKAILHYEILGPPISLRDPSHPIGSL